jgi:hypothetical protein
MVGIFPLMLVFIYIVIIFLQANPSRGETLEVKSWSSRMGVGHRASNSIPEKQILL